MPHPSFLAPLSLWRPSLLGRMGPDFACAIRTHARQFSTSLVHRPVSRPVLAGTWVTAALLAALGVGIGVTARYPQGIQSLIVGKASDYLSRKTGWAISIGQVLPMSILPWMSPFLRLRRIVVSQKDENDIFSLVSQHDPSVDLTIEAVDVSLSVWRYLMGKGLVQNVSIRGLRGLLPRDEDEEASPTPVKLPYFDLSGLHLEDVVVAMVGQDGAVPVEIHALSASRVRSTHFLEDILMADHAAGTFDHRLFSLRSAPPLYSHGGTAVRPDQNLLRMDGVSLAALAGGLGGVGPLAWVSEGAADLTVLIERKRAKVSQRIYFNDDCQHGILSWFNQDECTGLKIDMALVLNDVHAVAPSSMTSLSAVERVVVRPVVAYLNNARTQIPLNFSMMFSQDELNGAVMPSDVQLMDRVSDGVTEQLVSMLEVQKQNKIRAALRFLHMSSKDIAKGVSRWAERVWQDYTE